MNHINMTYHNIFSVSSLSKRGIILYVQCILHGSIFVGAKEVMHENTIETLMFRYSKSNVVPFPSGTRIGVGLGGDVSYPHTYHSIPDEASRFRSLPQAGMTSQSHNKSSRVGTVCHPFFAGQRCRRSAGGATNHHQNHK